MTSYLQSSVGLAVLGFTMVGALIALVLWGRVSPLVAMIVVPFVATLAGGSFAELGPMVTKGLAHLAPVVVMITFAILFFSLMLDAGLFEPLVRFAVRFTRDDPMRVTLATAAIALIVAFCGDAMSTGLVLVAAFLPVYRRLRMDPAILGMITAYAIAVQNLSPWAGPNPRVSAALSVDPMSLYVSLLPAIGAGATAVCAIALNYGLRERRRLHDQSPGSPNEEAFSLEGGEAIEHAMVADAGAARPKLIWVNLGLTVALLAGLTLGGISPVVLFPLASCAALLLNYPSFAEQRERVAAHASNIVSLMLVFFAAGIFIGVLNGTGMIEAMASAITASLPRSATNFFALMIALLSLPLNYLIPNDAFYFGAIPVLAKTAEVYGVTAQQTAAASLMGVPVHVLSPILPHVYIFAALLGVAPGPYLRRALPGGILVSLAMIAAAIASGAFPATS